MKLVKTSAPIARGARVAVHEQGIRPWFGVATAVKWSPVSGWWIDVKREDGGTYVVASHRVEAL